MKNTVKAAVIVVAVAACGPRGAVVETGAPGAGLLAQVDSATMLRDLSVLAHDSMEGRAVATPGNAKARAFLLRRFSEIGLAPVGGTSHQHPFSYTGRNATTPTNGVNIVGMVRGTAQPDRYIVVTAHYDHVGVRQGEIFNGADDNASGTAALLQVAQHFVRNRPRHSMIFVAFDAEESNLQGARAFVANPPVPAASIALNVNMDMVGRNDRGELYVAGTYHYPQLLPIVQRVVAVSEVALIPGHDRPGGSPGDDWTSASDHGPFHAAQIPFLYFGVEDHADYHKATDEFERIQPGFYARAARTVLAAVRALDASL